MRVELHIGGSTSSLTSALEALVREGVEELRAGVGAQQSILDGTVRYRREPRGSEQWRTRGRVLLEGYGDCEDLAAALAAELRVAGHPARAIVRRARGAPGYHAVVRLRGRELDPSAWLGMGGSS